MSDLWRDDEASTWYKALALIGSSAAVVPVAGGISTVKFIRDVGPASGLPQHRYLVSIPLAREVFDLL